MFRFCHILIPLLFSVTIGAQTTDLSSVFNAEKALHEKITLLRSGPYDWTKDSLHHEILQIFTNILNYEESFSYTWPALDMIGKIKSADQNINIFTWNMQNEKGEYYYSGIIQHRIPHKKKKDEISVYTLSDNSEIIKNPETQFLSDENWFGALYYSIIDFTYRRETYYLLLGFDFNSNFSNKKIIEILRIDDDKVHFGGEIKRNLSTIRRIIFEYSSDIVMTLRYDEKLKKVVFDHLVPLDPMFNGVFRFYVPDGSYDALLFEKGEFTFVTDVDARN